MPPAHGRNSSTQIHSWFRPVLMTWMMSKAWRRIGRISNRNDIFPLSNENLGSAMVAGCRQRKGHNVVTARRAEGPVAAGADDQILTLVASRTVGHGR